MSNPIKRITDANCPGHGLDPARILEVWGSQHERETLVRNIPVVFFVSLLLASKLRLYRSSLDKTPPFFTLGNWGKRDPHLSSHPLLPLGANANSVSPESTRTNPYANKWRTEKNSIYFPLFIQTNFYPFSMMIKNNPDGW
jgi:hypothetical protein